MPQANRKTMTHSSSSLSSCFRPTPTSVSDLLRPGDPPPPPPPAPTTGNSGNHPNLTTCLYHTELGLATLTWCRHLIGRSLHIHLRLASQDHDFRLHIKPFLFWRKHGSKKYDNTSSRKIEIYWDFAKAKFGSGSDPQSGFYVSVVVDGEMTLLVGDSPEEAYLRTKARKPERSNQVLMLRREHVFGDKFYTTKARFGGKTRDISIDCRVGDGGRLCFSVDEKRVVEIKQLKWKFRGNKKVEIDGVGVNVSWDVFNWLFEDVEDRHAVFMFRFERDGIEDQEEFLMEENISSGELMQGFSGYLGMNSVERKKLKKSSFKARSSSFSSMSSAASSACSSSVMEWTSKEENELQKQSGFSLLVYAWKN